MSPRGNPSPHPKSQSPTGGETPPPQPAGHRRYVVSAVLFADCSSQLFYDFLRCFDSGGVLVHIE
jgi:hypothetical protein